VSSAIHTFLSNHAEVMTFLTPYPSFLYSVDSFYLLTETTHQIVFDTTVIASVLCFRSRLGMIGFHLMSETTHRRVILITHSTSVLRF
jgi:hypothetical protein